MNWIVGLGNPGARYSKTRHNVGFRVVQLLSRRWSIAVEKNLCRSKVGEGHIQRAPVGLCLPQTMMNSSGEAVVCLLKRRDLEPTQLLLVCDDVSLPLGVIRLRSGGSAGGHHGLESVIELTGTEEIPRLRVGIRTEAPGADLVDFVLGNFRPGEKKLLEESLTSAADACDVWLKQGIHHAMNQFNRRVECRT